MNLKKINSDIEFSKDKSNMKKLTSTLKALKKK